MFQAGMRGRIGRAGQIYRDVGLRRLVMRVVHRLRRAMGWITVEEATWHRYKARIDAEFDEAHGVRTGGVDDLYGLSIVGPNARHGVSHIASDPHEFSQALAAVAVDHSRFSFVDLGCGRGRALLLAARLPFRTIVGVEFAAELFAAAQANVATLAPEHRARIRLVHGDASLFEAPAEPLVVFLYHPFFGDVMRKVARRLTQDVTAHPRPVQIVYLNPLCRDVWLAEGWFETKTGPNFAVLAHPQARGPLRWP
jgi:SAM-dependent methyltransferase